MGRLAGRAWLGIVALALVALGHPRIAAAQPAEARPDAQMLLDLDLLKDVDLAKDRALFQRLRLLERLRVLESLKLLESPGVEPAGKPAAGGPERPSPREVR